MKHTYFAAKAEEQLWLEMPLVFGPQRPAVLSARKNLLCHFRSYRIPNLLPIILPNNAGKNCLAKSGIYLHLWKIVESY